ncbi:MAG: type IV pilus secretin PilQ [Acidobacteriota bacterium]
MMRSRAKTWVLMLALPAALSWAGCASSAASQPASGTDASAETTVSGSPSAAVEPTDTAVEVRTVELLEGAPDAALRVSADGDLIWTGYRDELGRLIVELPNAVLADALPEEMEGAGFVTAIALSESYEGGKPTTRIVVDSGVPFEHSMAGEGASLEVFLMPSERTAEAAPTATADAELDYEPLPAADEETLAAAEELEAPPAIETAALEPAPVAVDQRVGTADEPLHAPAPAGPLASRLDGVEILPSARGTAVRIAGDGEFSYSTFALSDPNRFVIDLEGVINQSATSTMVIDGVDVERVRMAQFRPDPDPVSRVVFDLTEQVVPQVERTGEGLVVRFGAPATPAVESADLAGVGAENGTDGFAQGGSEVETSDLYADDSYEVEEAYEATPDATTGYGAPEVAEEPAVAAYEPVAVEPQPSTYEAPLETYEVTVEQEPVIIAQATPPVEVTPPAALEGSSTSDLELFRRAEVKLEEPTDAAAGTQSFTPQAIGGAEKEYVGEPISFSLRDSDLVETLRAFAVLSGLNLVIQPGVQGSVTVELVDVPWDQAFEQILKINSLGYELEGNVMRIAPITTLRAEAEERQRLEQARSLSVPLLTIIKRLSYANAQAVATLLQSRGGVLSQRGSVIVDGRTNTLIIKELPTIMDTVIAVIENLDIAEPQVMIEARIVETRKSFTRTLGVDWSLGGAANAANGNTTGLTFPATVDGSGGVNLVTGGNTGFLNLALGSLGGTFNIDAELVAAENEGLVNVLSAPKVATLNNERASIQSGFQIPIQTVANNTVSVQFVEATLKLEVTPQVTAEGTILMQINIQKRNPEFALAVQGAQAAPISTQEAQTRVIVRDGGTTVIGGIYEVSTNDGQDRVPGLANIPIFGHLFKNKRREDSNNELLIFITPRVMRL